MSCRACSKVVRGDLLSAHSSISLFYGMGDEGHKKLRKCQASFLFNVKYKEALINRILLQSFEIKVCISICTLPPLIPLKIYSTIPHNYPNCYFNWVTQC